MNNFHTPVLLKEVTEYLNIKKGKKYIDATIGGGGHALEIIKRGGVVLGIDVDREAIEYVKKILRNKDIKILSEETNKALNISVSQYPNITLVRGNFREINKIAHSKGFDKVAGIIFDLGISSYQLEKAERGFSFEKEGPLDMRMDQELSLAAKDLLNGLTKGELYELFSKLGEESSAWELSRRIIRARRIRKILTTGDLREVVRDVVGGKFVVKSLARVFQALRIAINDELNCLKEALQKALTLLKRNGRLLVISFHSLEDRIVKQDFIEFQKKYMGIIITKKPIVPSIEEINTNTRARSAKLRIFEKN